MEAKEENMKENKKVNKENIKINENRQLMVKTEISENSNIERKRKYGIDLLKLIAMIMVTTFHFIQYSELYKRSPPFKIKTYIFHYIMTWGLNCNSIFGIITGYLSLNARHKLSPIILLMITVTFYNIIIEFILMISNRKPYKVYQFLFMLFPFTRSLYWYYTSYVSLFFYMPYINSIIKNISKKEFKKICLFMFILHCCIVPIFNNTNAYGIFGCGFLMIFMYYLFGAYIKLYGIYFFEKKSKIQLFFIAILCHILHVFIIYLSDINKHKFNKSLFEFDGFLIQFNIFYMISTICYIYIFKDLKLNKYIEKFLSIISPSIFYVYIIGFNKYTLKFYKLYSLYKKSFPQIIWTILYKNILIWVISLSIDYIRRLLFNYYKLNILSEKIAKKLEEILEKLSEINEYTQSNNEIN